MNTTRQIYEKTAPYGIDFDTVNDVMHRIGDPESHRLLPVQSQMKGVILNDLGQEVMELPYDDWTTAARDGSLGQVMVRVPEHWMKFDGTRASNTINRVWLSASPKSGFIHIPTYYVGAYEAALQRSTSKLASVVNDTADYRGGNNASSWDATYRSLLGMPATNISLTDFRSYARNRNSGDTRWNAYPYFLHRDLYWLFAVEYASFNSQAAFTAVKTQEGYAQGGLGDGVTTWTDSAWNSHNSYNPIVPCGVTDSLGNSSGTVNYSVKDSSNNVLITFAVPRYRGIENIFGHIWKWSDGALIDGTSSINAVYTCDRPALFNSTSYSNYKSIGNEVRSNGYVKKIIFGNDGDIFPTQVGGSASTWYYDYHYTNTSSNSLRGCLLGGSVSLGSRSGLGCVYADLVPSGSGLRIGSRLCFFPR